VELAGDPASAADQRFGVAAFEADAAQLPV
jgi:hypothetical protein